MLHLIRLAVAVALVASVGCKKKAADEGTTTGTGSAMVAPTEDAAAMAAPDAGTGMADGDGGMMAGDGGMDDAGMTGDGDGGMTGDGGTGAATP